MGKDYNLGLLLEKSEQISLGIRSRQAGITLKEYFLNQKEKSRNIYKAQKEKLTTALEVANGKVKEGKNSTSSQTLTIVNKAGKNEKRALCVEGQTAEKVFNSLKKIVLEVYSIIKYRCSQINKLCEEGIRKASLIIKGKSTSEELSMAKAIKVDVAEAVKLLNESLVNMRDVFSGFHKSGVI